MCDSGEPEPIRCPNCGVSVSEDARMFQCPTCLTEGYDECCFPAGSNTECLDCETCDDCDPEDMG